MVTLTQSFLIRFLLNLVYGLVPSTSHSSSNAGFVRHPITKMASKWPPPINIRCHGHSNSVIFNRISSKFRIWIASNNFIYGLLPSFFRSISKTGFFRHPITKIAQNGRHLSISAVVVTLTQSFLIRFLSNFIYGLLPSTSRSRSNTGFVRHQITKMADKMAATIQYPLSWSL